ncbi:MAG: hypothetical protein V1927_03620 [Candidatus Omnitrophota bacterium]
MKKLIAIFIIILVTLYAVLSILGSGGEYNAEKLYYRAMKVNKKIAANPDVVPPKLLGYVENDLKTLLEKYPRTEIAKTANITLAEFYIFNKRYDDALSKIDSIIKANNKNPIILSTAYFLKGRAYEKQDKWASALKEYEIVRDDYIDTELGIQMPLYIAKHYSDKGKEANAAQAYNDAALFYEKLEKNNSKKLLGYIASKLLLQTYINSGNYEQAGKTLEETLNRYKSMMVLTQLLPLVENIFVKELKRPEKAIEIYENIKEGTYDDRLKRFLDKKIEKLNSKKWVN